MAGTRKARVPMAEQIRLTQRGHAIHSMDDLLALYEKAYTADCAW